jgi:hypothetical protein
MAVAGLAELERAELRAREGRLAAMTEADRRIEAATAEAARIRAGIGEAISAAMTIRQAEHEATCRADLAAIERGAGELATGPRLAEPLDLDGAEAILELAVDRLVAAILGEGEG